MSKNFFKIPFTSLFFNSLTSTNKGPSQKSTNKQKISEINVKYSELLLKKRFKCFLIFYMSNIFFIIICCLYNEFRMENSFELRLFRLILMIIILIMLFAFVMFMDKIFQSPYYKYINRLYFFVLNILNTIISIEFSKNTIDFSLPSSFYYFWMGYRLCSTSIITKIITRSMWVTTSTLFIELIYIIYKFNENVNEIYKSIFYSMIIFFVYTYFFYIYEKLLENDSQIKHYQKEDNKLFKKMLNRLPESLVILNQSDHLFYSNYNAQSFIQNCSTILNPFPNRNTLITIQELFKNLRILSEEEVKEEIQNETPLLAAMHVKEEFTSQKDLFSPPKNNRIDNFEQNLIVILLKS